MRPNPESVFRAVQLLPHVVEPQVIIELIFKCIAHPPLLQFLNSRVTRSTGMLCVEKLTEPTLKKLTSQQISKAKGENELGSMRCMLVTFSDVVKWWMSSFETVEHGALIAETLLSADLLVTASLYRAVLYASPTAFAKGVALSHLAIQCGEKTFRSHKLVFHPLYNTREDDDDQFLVEYTRTIIDLFLEGHRCPSVLQKIISARIQARIQTAFCANAYFKASAAPPRTRLPLLFGARTVALLKSGQSGADVVRVTVARVTCRPASGYG
eukprot:IDg10640t1